jgi:quercetin dioxygenase-like cupin family protein
MTTTRDVRDFVNVRALGRDNDPTLLEQGGGYIFEKEGALTMLYHNGEPMSFLAYIQFLPEKARGNHYHPRKHENVLVVSGLIRAKYLLPQHPEDVLELTLKPGDIVSVEPGCVHSYVAVTGGVGLEFSRERFELRDTVRYEVSW